MPNHDDLRNAYAEMKNALKNEWDFKFAGDAILNLSVLSLRFLESQSEFIDLVSRVPGKDYVSYGRNNIVARPANKRFFLRSVERITELWEDWVSGKIDYDDLAMMSYTVALAPCLAMELFDRQNKKGPATFFEYFIGYIFTRTLQIYPTKKAVLPIRDRLVRMTMDFLFELKDGKTRLHLPVKMSTRERVIQAWSHQRLLDEAYGKGKYIGIMVIFSETKMDSRSHEVVEICVPDQWLAYQMLLSRLDKIYYFDVPNRYQELTDTFPDIIEIRQFKDFFTQIRSIVH